MSANKIMFKNALLIFSGIVVYYFLMKLLDLESYSSLRLLNFIFVLWGINNAIKTNIKENGEILYVRNLAIGVGTSALAVGMAIIGLIVYASFINPEFISLVQESFLWGRNLTLPLLVFALAIEGIASSVISSFILMQYYKNYKPA
ncbi:MAG: hypothetical protein JKY02_07775 [Flavobacteriaceae bacterium]|nr:hypothetical protein [Flavobacteriaceae bacterium]